MNDNLKHNAASWQQDGTDWLLISGNRTIAKLIPNSGNAHLPEVNWLSVMEESYQNSPWHAVDFATLADGKRKLAHWWRNDPSRLST